MTSNSADPTAPEAVALETSAAGSADDGIALASERLTIDKRMVETGRIRIKTVVDEQPHWVRETLASESVSIERVPVDRVVESPPEIRRDGDVLVIPLVEEVLVLEKRLRVKEELHVRFTRHVDEVESPVTLKSTRAVVERE